MKLVKISDGEFLYGEEKQKIYLPEYYIGKYPVTNKQYCKFVKATGRKWKSPFGFEKSYKNHPAIHVSWYDATAYCEWLSEKTDREYRLPTEQEWEKAARGTDGREYPWGNEWKDGMCNARESGIGDTTPVGQFSPTGDSPFGVVDMVGNVWEWTGSDYSKFLKVMRGGTWYNSRSVARCAYRSWDLPDGFYGYLGFRVVSPPPQQYSILIITIQRID